MASIIKVDTIQKPDGTAPSADDLGVNVAGNILQVDHDIIYTSHAVNTDSWAYANVGVELTAKKDNSKFLVVINYHTRFNQGDQHGVAPFVSINGGAYSIITTSTTFNETNRLHIGNTGQIIWTMDCQHHLYSPNLSKGQTFGARLYHKSRQGGLQYINDNGGGSSVTVYEIAG